MFNMTTLILIGLLAAACIAGYLHNRKVFNLLFALLIASVFVVLGFGQSGLNILLIFVSVILVSAGIGYCFREFLSNVLPHEGAKAIRSAPLTATFGLFVILIYLVAFLFAPWIAPFGEAEIVSDVGYAPPSETLLLGSDKIGRDIYSRLIYGARNTIGISLLATFLAFFFGTTLGLFVAIKGRSIDQLVSRIIDVFMSIPPLIFALLLISIFASSDPSSASGDLDEGWISDATVHLMTLVGVIAFIYIPPVYRLSRAVAGNIVVMDYIEAARLRGEGSLYLIFKEILPNATAPLVAEFGLRFCFVFLLIAGLSFLGLGIQPPSADWGSMVKDSANLIRYEPLIPLIPAGAIALLTVSVNFVVDWMLYRSSGLKT